MTDLDFMEPSDPRDSGTDSETRSKPFQREVLVVGNLSEEVVAQIEAAEYGAKPE